MHIDTWYGSRFVDSNIITQFYYNGCGILSPSVSFFNIAPNEFSTQSFIVAVWRIKLKAPKPTVRIDMPPVITYFN